MYPFFPPLILVKFGYFRQILENKNTSNIIVHKNQYKGEPSFFHADGQTDGHDKVDIALRNFEGVPEKNVPRFFSIFQFITRPILK